MNESSKNKKHFGELEWSVLKGKGIDIGCGPDPVTPDVRKFDVDDGDANEITKYVHDTFDYVYASHCLEHMYKPREALLEWWKLVKPGGHLFFFVPDEDLYEQGVFPSQFNSDHKATFTISKAKSWSPISVNVLDLALSLPEGQLLSLELQDYNYDRRKMGFGRRVPFGIPLMRRLYYSIKFRTGWNSRPLEILLHPYDQTARLDVSAQIQCIVRKRA